MQQITQYANLDENADLKFDMLHAEGVDFRERVDRCGDSYKGFHYQEEN